MKRFVSFVAAAKQRARRQVLDPAKNRNQVPACSGLFCHFSLLVDLLLLLYWSANKRQSNRDGQSGTETIINVNYRF